MWKTVVSGSSHYDEKQDQQHVVSCGLDMRTPRLRPGNFSVPMATSASTGLTILFALPTL
jgi:hypothetical protein